MTTTPVPTSHEPLVDVTNLHVDFPRPRGIVHAVRGLDLRILPGESVGLIGESGSGKSVTARTLVGLTGRRATVRADRLQVAGIDGLTAADAAWRRIRGDRIGLVLQDALVSLDPLRTVGAELSEAILAHRKLDRDEVTARIHQLLADVGIPDPEVRASQYPHELSGGLRQRALIASAIASDPDLVIADEPTTALDVTVQKQVLDLLRARRDAGAALLLVSHDLAVVSGITDRVIVMRDGVAVERGPTEQVLSDPRHDYTKMLLAAVPSAGSRGHRLSSPERTPVARHAIDTTSTVLDAQRLTKRYAGPHGMVRTAVDDVSLSLHRGEILGIVGESGSGKSTLARVLLGLIEPDHGRVTLDGAPWSPLPEKQRRPRRHLAQFIAQDPLSSFDPHYTVEQVVAEPIRSSERSRRRRHERVLAALHQVGLDASHLEASPRSLSGGQRQRVAIARALVARPEVIIADEPVSALDVSVQAQVLDLLADLQAETAASMVFISHDLGVVHHLADRVVVMKDGQVVEVGTADQVFTAPGHPYTQALVAALPRLAASHSEEGTS